MKFLFKISPTEAREKDEILRNERVFMCLPENLHDIMNNYKNFLRKITAHSSKDEQEKALIQFCAEVYSQITPETLNLYKVTMNLRKNAQRPEVVRLHYVEVLKIETITSYDVKVRFLK